jgi:hypothetical protein
MPCVCAGAYKTTTTADCVHANCVCAGLGTEAGACSIVSGEENKGDGIVLCGKHPEEAMRDRGWNATTYKVGVTEAPAVALMTC